MGRVLYEFGFSTFCQVLLGQKQLTSCAILWKITDLSQPNQTILPDGPNCRNRSLEASNYLTHTRERVALVESETVEAEIVDWQQRATLLRPRPLAERNFLGAFDRTVGIIVLVRAKFINSKRLLLEDLSINIIFQ